MYKKKKKTRNFTFPAFTWWYFYWIFVFRFICHTVIKDCTQGEKKGSCFVHDLNKTTRENDVVDRAYHTHWRVMRRVYRYGGVYLTFTRNYKYDSNVLIECMTRRCKCMTFYYNTCCIKYIDYARCTNIARIRVSWYTRSWQVISRPKD